ncbi:MAG: hypothetical protein H8E37_10845, partial [Planctomycetes bacterium]|nr:hypothetical protein [Planctomycetota bacterium]
MRNARIAMVIAVGLALLLVTQFAERNESQAQEKPPTVALPKGSSEKGKVIGIPSDSAEEKSKSVVPFMHAKLAHSHKVLEGLVTKDFGKISNAAESLMITSLQTPGIDAGKKRDDEVFEHLKLEFLRLSVSDSALERAAT